MTASSLPPLPSAASITKLFSLTSRRSRASSSDASSSPAPLAAVTTAPGSLDAPDRAPAADDAPRRPAASLHRSPPPSSSDAPKLAPYESIVLEAAGAPLALRHYPPRREGGVGVGAVLIAPAMGVPQRFYAPFASWLASAGFHAVSFDFRGSGESRSAPLSHLDTDIFGWAEHDAAVALRWLATRTADLPITWIGHSLGGQIIPLVPGHERIAKIITIATGSGYWRENSEPLRRKAWLLWWMIAPALTPLFGYFPGRKLGVVGDLPRGVIEQWRRWCLHPEYCVGVEGEAVRARFAQVTAPLTSISFTDDEMMSAANTESLHSFYANASRSMRRLSPADLGLARVGHFGFFREERLWPRLLGAELETLP